MAKVGIEIRDTAKPALKDIKKSLAKVMSSGVFAAAQLTVGIIRREIMRLLKPGTGGLARSFKETLIDKSSGGASAGAFSDLVYARIQDEGGIIRPKFRKNLAIPLKSARVPLGKWPRDFPPGELTFIKSKKGNSLLARVSKGKIEPVFVLKPSVTIKGVGYIESARRKAEPKIVKLLDGKVSVSVKKAVST